MDSQPIHSEDRSLSSPVRRLLVILAALVGFLAISLWSTPASADQPTLLDDDSLQIDGYIGPATSVTEIDGEAEYMLGGRLGWMFDDVLVLGVGGMATPEMSPFGASGSRDLQYRFGYFGGLAEIVFFNDWLIHLTADGLFAAGWASTFRAGPSEESKTSKLDDTDVFVIDAGLNVEVNVFEWMRVTAGPRFRWVNGSDLQNLDDDTLTGLGGMILLKFGDF